MDPRSTLLTPPMARSSFDDEREAERVDEEAYGSLLKHVFQEFVSSYQLWHASSPSPLPSLLSKYSETVQDCWKRTQQPRSSTQLCNQHPSRKVTAQIIEESIYLDTEQTFPLKLCEVQQQLRSLQLIRSLDLSFLVNLLHQFLLQHVISNFMIAGVAGDVKRSMMRIIARSLFETLHKVFAHADDVKQPDESEQTDSNITQKKKKRDKKTSRYLAHFPFEELSQLLKLVCYRMASPQLLSPIPLVSSSDVQHDSCLSQQDGVWLLSLASRCHGIQYFGTYIAQLSNETILPSD